MRHIAHIASYHLFYLANLRSSSNRIFRKIKNFLIYILETEALKGHGEPHLALNLLTTFKEVVKITIIITNNITI